MWFNVFVLGASIRRKPRPHVILANLWRLLAACLQDRQPTLNHLPLIHVSYIDGYAVISLNIKRQVAKEEITSDSRAIDDVLICLEKFPDTLLRRYDVLVSISSRMACMIACFV